MGTAVSLNLPEELNARLEEIANRTGRSKDSYIVEALNEKLEDLEDLYLAEESTRAIKEGRSRTYTLDEVDRDIGLAD